MGFVLVGVLGGRTGWLVGVVREWGLATGETVNQPVWLPAGLSEWCIASLAPAAGEACLGQHW